MKNESSIQLPVALLSSDDYRALSPEKRDAFLARIAYCKEIAAAAEEAVACADTEFLSAIDDIELDAYSVMSSFSDTTRAVSPYLVHSSWTFESDKKSLGAHVEAGTADFLASKAFLFQSTAKELKDWLRGWVSTMLATHRHLEDSTSFTESIAQLIVMDALLAQVLVFTAAVRINAAINQF